MFYSKQTNMINKLNERKLRIILTNRVNGLSLYFRKAIINLFMIKIFKCLH